MGFKPAWSKNLNKFSPLINARKETLMKKISLKNLIQLQDVVVPS